jgi:hypothetical protein
MFKRGLMDAPAPAVSIAFALALFLPACGGDTSTSSSSPGSTCVNVEQQICSEASKLGTVGDPCSPNQDATTVAHFADACQKMSEECAGAKTLECSD